MTLEGDINRILSSSNELSSDCSKLRDRIISGESTGDKIRDFAIVYCGELKGGSYTQRLIDLDRDIKAYQGQLVLVINQDEERVRGGDVSFFGRRHHSIEYETLRLGVLNGEINFDIDRSQTSNSRILIPTQNYAQKGGMFLGKACDGGEEWSLEKGKIDIWAKSLSGSWLDWFPRNFFDESMEFGDLKHSLDFVFGDEKVEMYFRLEKPNFDMALRRMNEGKFDTKFKKYLKDHERLNLGYISALRLLGREPPRDFIEKFGEITLRRKKEITYHLLELTKLEREVSGDIESLYSKVDRRPVLEGRVLHSTGPDLPGLTQDDARVISIGDRQRLSDARKKIESCLTEAIKLGMHKERIEMDLEPGVRLILPDYILETCKKYKITLPN